jgi:hypothetical protein
MSLFNLFSPSKGEPKENKEMIVILMPLTWDEKGLKDSLGVVFQIPPIPTNGDKQVEF